MISIGSYIYAMVADCGDTVEIQRLGEPDAMIHIVTREFFGSIGGVNAAPTT